MLGDILAALTDPIRAEQMLSAVGRPAVRARIAAAARAEGVSIGDVVAAKVRHSLDHGDPDLWTELLSVMAGSPQPAAAAVDRLLAGAFPDPTRVRFTRVSA